MPAAGQTLPRRWPAPPYMMNSTFSSQPDDQPEATPPPDDDQPEATPPPDDDQPESTPPPDDDQPESTPPPDDDQPEATRLPDNDQPEATRLPDNDQPEATRLPDNDQPEATRLPDNDQPEATRLPDNDQPEATRPPDNDQPEATPPPDVENVINQPPAIIPSPEYKTVEVVPASKIPPTPSHAPVDVVASGIAGGVAAATLLQGYCSEPAYTIIDGPTAVWMPVIGCISSKKDCCPTPTPTKGNEAKDGNAEFPISMLPSQGTVTGCPKDYHTVDGTACCPSAYWLWSTSLGGQVPCYSSLKTKMTPPPIPDTLVAKDGMPMTAEASLSSLSPGRISELTMSQKPTSAIINIGFAMQYPMGGTAPKLGTKGKIGVGVGVTSGALIFAFLLWFLGRKYFANRSSKGERQNAEGINVSQRFGSGVDMSRVAHAPAGVGRVYEGKQYTGVPSSSVNY